MSLPDILPAKRDNPDPGERVLVLDSNYGWQIGWLNREGKWVLGYLLQHTANALEWQPLPEIPEHLKNKPQQ